MTLATLVARARPAFGTYSAIAHAVGVSPSALLRGMKGEAALGAEALIKLAEVIGESPDAVLRAAGKRETADRLVRLYDTPPKPLSDVDRALVALSPAKKRGLLAVVK